MGRRTSWSAAIVVFAAAKVTRHAQRLRVAVDDNHRVDAIFVALPAVVFDRLAGAILAGRRHGAYWAAFAQLSFSDTVRLNTGAPGLESGSTEK